MNKRVMALVPTTYDSDSDEKSYPKSDPKLLELPLQAARSKDKARKARGSAAAGIGEGGKKEDVAQAGGSTALISSSPQGVGGSGDDGDEDKKLILKPLPEDAVGEGDKEVEKELLDPNMESGEGAALRSSTLPFIPS